MRFLSPRFLVTVAAVALLAIGVGAGIVLMRPPGPSTAPTPSSVAIEAVTMLGERELIAVGATKGRTDPAVVARSSDGGQHWTATVIPLPALTQVAAAGSRVVASRYCLPPSAGGHPLEPGPSSCLFASDDGAVTWIDLDAGTLVDPTFADASYGWAHEQFPDSVELFETLDGGTSWSLLDAPCPTDQPLVYRAVATGRQIGYLLCFAQATEAGQAWSLIERSASGATATLFEGRISNGEGQNGLHDEVIQGFSIRPDGSGFIWTSSLYRTTDAGRSWSVVPPTGLGPGSFRSGGYVIDANSAYLVRGTTSTTSVVEYRSGTFRTLVTWPRSIVAGR
jgi:photosystem II stability/assembly factor-like uncharacterized protein